MRGRSTFDRGALPYSNRVARTSSLLRRTEALKAVAEACTAAHKASGLQQGGKFATVQLDVADKAQIASFIDKIPQDLRSIDILGMSSRRLLRVYSALTVLLPISSEQCRIRARCRENRRHLGSRHGSHVHRQRFRPHLPHPAFHQRSVIARLRVSFMAC